MNEKNFFGLEKIINKGGGGGWNKERGEEVRNKFAGGRLLEPLEYKLREEKVANCEKLYCCGRKSCEIFLAILTQKVADIKCCEKSFSKKLQTLNVTRIHFSKKVLETTGIFSIDKIFVRL